MVGTECVRPMGRVALLRGMGDRDRLRRGKGGMRGPQTQVAHIERVGGSDCSRQPPLTMIRTLIRTVFHVLVARIMLCAYLNRDRTRGSQIASHVRRDCLSALHQAQAYKSRRRRSSQNLKIWDCLWPRAKWLANTRGQRRYWTCVYMECGGQREGDGTIGPVRQASGRGCLPRPSADRSLKRLTSLYAVRMRRGRQNLGLGLVTGKLYE
jgi:hypothetical protein